MTDELEKLCKNNSLINPYYMGTFPADNFPEIDDEKNCWVWNTE